MKTNILLVEDDEADMIQFMRAIRGLGINFTHAENGLEAMELLRDNQFDSIYTDINMPLVDGVTLVQEVRKSKENKKGKTVIVGMSGNEYVSNEIQYLQLGFDNFINKNISIEDLRKTVEMYL